MKQNSSSKSEKWKSIDQCALWLPVNDNHDKNPESSMTMTRLRLELQWVGRTIISLLIIMKKNSRETLVDALCVFSAKVS